MREDELKSVKTEGAKVKKAKPEKADSKRPDSGARNLTILGISAIIITVAVTGLELWIYHESGDIYLDRSRPGFLPDAEEIEEDTSAETNFVYSDSGEIDKGELEEYLKELKKVNDSIKKIQYPYSTDVLSNKSLGISAEEE